MQKLFEQNMMSGSVTTNKTVAQAIAFLKANPPKKPFMKELETSFFGRFLSDQQIIEINWSIEDGSTIAYEDFRVFLEASMRLGGTKHINSPYD